MDPSNPYASSPPPRPPPAVAVHPRRGLTHGFLYVLAAGFGLMHLAFLAAIFGGLSAGGTEPVNFSLALITAGCASACFLMAYRAYQGVLLSLGGMFFTAFALIGTAVEIENFREGRDVNRDIGVGLIVLFCVLGGLLLYGGYRRHRSRVS